MSDVRPDTVIGLLSYITSQEDNGFGAPNRKDVFSDKLLTDDSKPGYIPISIGSWQDDGQFCRLTKKGRLLSEIIYSITSNTRIVDV